MRKQGAGKINNKHVLYSQQGCQRLFAIVFSGGARTSKKKTKVCLFICLVVFFFCFFVGVVVVALIIISEVRQAWVSR